jgi:hypothetical protein
VPLKSDTSKLRLFDESEGSQLKDGGRKLLTAVLALAKRMLAALEGRAKQLVLGSVDEASLGWMPWPADVVHARLQDSHRAVSSAQKGRALQPLRVALWPVPVPHS